MATATLFSSVDGDLIFDANIKNVETFPFSVFIAWDEAVDGLLHTHFSVSATVNAGTVAARIRRLEGSQRLFVLHCDISSFTTTQQELIVGDRNGTITVTLSANAVSQGNPAATLTFNYNYYRQYLSGRLYNSSGRPDDFTLLASNVGRLDSLTYADGLLYGHQYNTTNIRVFNASTGVQDTARTITLPANSSRAVFFKNSFYSMNNRDIERYLRVTNTNYTTVANTIEGGSNWLNNTNFIFVGKRGFYLGLFRATGSAGRAARAEVPGTAGRFTPGTPTVPYDPDTGTDGTEGTPGRYTPGTPTIPAIEAIPSTLRRMLSPFFISFEAFTALQETPGPSKSIDPEEYSIDTNGIPTFTEGRANSFDFEDHFVVGYDGEHHYVRLGPYLLLADDDLKVDPETALRNADYADFDISPAFAFDDTYIYRASGNHGNTNLYRYEKSKLYKPQPRARVYPILVSENSTIDLRNYVQYFTRIVFDENYDPQSFITLSGHTLSIGTVTAETAVSVKLRAVNNRGATATGAIVLDIVIQKPATTPTWVDFQNITMAANTSLDVSNLVSDADSLSSVNLPTGASFSGETLSIGTTGGAVTLRAVKGSNTTDVTFTVDIETVPDLDALDSREYLIEIAGVDVSSDLVSGGEPVISKSLDLVRANEYKVNTSTFSLRARNGYYLSKTPTNFWSDNSLNRDGYREPVKIYLKYTKDGTEGQALIFSGNILEIRNQKRQNVVEFSVNDFADRLRTVSTRSPNAPLQSLGIEKYAQTTPPTEDNFEGVYPVKAEMTPILQGTVDAWSDGTKLTIRDTLNSSEGVSVDNNAFVDNNAIRTQGGPVGAAPLLKYRIPYRRRRISFFTELLALTGGVLNPDFDIDLPVLTRDCIQSRGNIQYNVLSTRITHIFRDWVYDSTDNKIYILLSQPDKNYQDLLVEHDIQTDEQTIIEAFDADLTCLKLEYAGSGTFYILTTESLDRDRSQTPLPVDTLAVVGKYDRALGASSKILRYVRSTDTTTDFVAATAARPPQPGTHYGVGFTHEESPFAWKGIVPDSRGTFKRQGTNLYYRYATATQYGIARAANNGTVTALWSINNGNHFEHLKFDFDVNSSGTVYFAHVEQSITGSTLYIKRHQSGTATTLLTDTKTFSQLTDIAAPAANTGGWYAGVHEVLLDGNDLYLCVEIGRTDQYYDSGGTIQLTRSVQKGAGQALYKVDVSAGTPSLTLIEGFDFVQRGARSLVKHDSKVFFAQSPAETYKFGAYNPDIQTTETAAALAEGKLKSVNASGVVTDHGSIWFDVSRSKGVTAKALSIGENLHLNSVYSTPDSVLLEGDASASPDNSQWIIYGPQLEFILADLAPTDVFSALADVARKVNAVLKVDRNRIRISSRQIITALLNGAITATATTLTYDNADSGFPSSGQGLINNEIVSWTGRTATQLTGVVRGVGATDASAHADNENIIFLDKLIEARDILAQQSDIDTQRIFNIIQSNDLLEKVQDDTSIEAFGDRVFSLNLGLTRHDECWVSYVFDQYLQEFKDVRSLISMELSQAWNIDLGNVINYQEGGIIQPVRVMSIRYSKSRTSITGRTISRG